MWKKFDTLIENPPARLESSDTCYYARDYASGKGYAHSETNNLISNFKKKICDRDKPGWRYKAIAIERFARELAHLLTGAPGSWYLAPVPSSKRCDDPEYDNRLEAVIDLVCRSCPNLIASMPVTRQVALQAAHLSGSSRPSPQQVRASLSWAGLPGPAATHPLIFLDDVITSGTTFKECQRLARQHAPSNEVLGVFWARTVWIEQSQTPT